MVETAAPRRQPLSLSRDLYFRVVLAALTLATIYFLLLGNVAAIMGTLMYLIEGEEHGFSNIPLSVYWAIVTMTTVGFGDLAPATPAGQLLATILMLMGYGIIAVPTGIVTAEITRGSMMASKVSTQSCPACTAQGHDVDAVHCKFCGALL